MFVKDRGRRESSGLVIAAIAAIGIAGCATELEGTPTSEEGVVASSRPPDTVASDLETWADAFCTAYGPLADATEALDEIPASSALSPANITNTRSALVASLPALDTLIEMPEPPVSDGRQIKAILDASHRAWRKLTTDVVAVIDSSPDGLSVNGAQRILDLAADADAGLTTTDLDRIEDFNSRIEQLGLPACSAMDGNP